MGGVTGFAFLTRCWSSRLRPDMHWSRGPNEEGVAQVSPILRCIVRTALKYICMLFGDLSFLTT